MKNTYKNIITATICSFFVILLSFCNSNKPEGQKKEEVKNEPLKHEHAEGLVELTNEQYKNAGIQVGKIEKRKLSGTIKVNGMLDIPPQNLVTISVPYGGTVKEITVLQGMKVKKGELIAVLENPVYIQLQLDYLDNKSKLNFMQLELKRQEELQKENVNAVKTLQQVSSEYESLKAMVDGLEEKLSMINISPELLQKNGISKQIRLFAPINGFVTQVNVNVGIYVNPNDVICKIVDTRHLHAELTVFEKDVISLVKGQKVRFTFNNESTERSATVYLIGKEIGADRTIRVHCHLDKEDQSLLPGMYLKATIETKSKNVWALPVKAVLQSEGSDYIFVSDGKIKHQNSEVSQFTMQKISKGISENGYAEVIFPEGFNTEALVVKEGAYDLLSKMMNAEE